MAIIFVRTLIIYITLLIIMRLMGKRQIGEMQPFEFIVTLLIAELGCIPMADISIPLLYGITAMVAVFILHQFMTILEQKIDFLKVAFDGKPSIVINKNGIDFKELKKNNLDVEDLIESLRSLGYFSINAVNYAIYESNGKLSAIKNPENENFSTCPLVLIKNGKLDKKNIKIYQLENKEIDKLINECGEKSYKQIGLLTMDGNGNYYGQAYNKNFVTGKYTLKKEVKW